MKVNFDNSYARLPDRFYTRQEPVPVDSPETIRVNEPLARRLGFDPERLATDEGAALAAGNRLFEGSEPIATVYAGHQFGGWVPQLGDGRAILLGEVLDEDGERFDVQLKGSGRTPYSRRGDGRSPLGPVLREYLISEAMAALGIPTTRALAAVKTGEEVRRETTLPGGVLARVARSHIRIGTFEYFAFRQDVEALEILFDHVVERHYPDLDPDGPMDLLRAVSKRQAQLVAKWQLVGFIHGVMNTDNMLLSGETIDYGPCAFMNEYDPATVFSSIDRRGRYAYGNQPPIAQWNLSRFAGTLLRMIDDDDAEQEAQEIIDAFPQMFRTAYGEGMARKLGLAEFEDDDWRLVEDLLELMDDEELDYTLTFRRLTELAGFEGDDGPQPIGELFEFPDAAEPWLDRWRDRLDSPESMRSENPAIIPRNHLVNAAIADAVERDDFDGFHELVDVLDTPYEAPSSSKFVRPPADEQRVEATFCGT